MKLWNHEYSVLIGNNYEKYTEKARYVFSQYSKRQIKRYEHVFTPFGCLRQSTQDELFALLALVADQAFSVKWNRPYTSCDGWEQIKVRQKSNDTDTHVRLKKQATLWLKTIHNVTDVEYETGSGGGICDLMSKDGRWIVECGATRPSKVWQQYDFEDHDNDKSSLVVFNDVGIVVFRIGKQIRQYREALRRWDEATVRQLENL